MFDRFYKIFVGIAVFFVGGFVVECIVLRGMPSVDLCLNGRTVSLPEERKICQKKVYWERVKGAWGREIGLELIGKEKLLEEELVGANPFELKILGWAQSGGITDIFISIDGKAATVKVGDYLGDYSLTIKNFSCCHEEGVRGLEVIPVLECYDGVSKKEFIVKSK